MDLRLEAIVLHNSLHGGLALQDTGTGIIEAKLAQQLAHLEQMLFFGIFINLRKAFEAMDRGRCLKILALIGVGPKMLRLIRNFWDSATNVCQAKGNYGRPFKAGHGVTQGGPLLAKLCNILVNAVVQEWMQLMRAMIKDTDGNLTECIEGLFAVYYVDDGYIASHDAEFLQKALNILVETFKCVGLATNMNKTQAMICTPGKKQVQLPADSYKRMHKGGVAGEELQRAMVCHVCDKQLQARSLHSHLSSAHDIHQQIVVAKALLEEWECVHYRADSGGRKDPIHCPFPGCLGVLSSPYMLRCHFRDLHPKDTVEIQGRETSCGASIAQCSAARGTCGTSTHKCACWAQSNKHSGNRPFQRPWLCISCSM